MGMRGYLMSLNELQGAAAKAGKLDVGDLVMGMHKKVWSDEYEDDDRICFVGKLWHGLHLLFAESAWEPTPGLGELFMGGTEVGEDLGYGPARYHSPASVKRFDDELRTLTDDALRERFSPEAFADANAYPQIWDESKEDLWRELSHYIGALRLLLEGTRGRGEGLVVAIL